MPEVTARHFEVAMREARRSVSDQDLAKYSAFAATLSQQRATIGGPGGLQNFKFPAGHPSGTGAGAGAGPTAAPAAAGDEDDLYG